MSEPRLPLLLHLCDSLFPIGGYAHSDGLEAATDAGDVTSTADLRSWIGTLLDETLVRTEGPAVVRAWHAWRGARWDDLRALDDEAHALRPSSAAREASRSVGTRLLRTWARLYPPAPGLADLCGPDVAWTLPVAFAVAAASTAADVRTTAEAFMYTRLAATTSAAMRLMRLGQLEAHRVLADALTQVPAATEAMLARHERPSAFAPILDIATMRHQYVTTRLFRS